MLPTDKPEFLKVLNGLAAIKPGVNSFTKEALEIWWASMSKWTIEEFKSAATQLAVSCEFMPNPYHFEQLRKAADVGKHEAWAVALERCKRHVQHDDDRITRAARLVGGYHAIGHTNVDQLPFLAKRFMDAYEEVGEAQQARELLPSANKLESSQIMKKLGVSL